VLLLTRLLSPPAFPFKPAQLSVYGLSEGAWRDYVIGPDRDPAGHGCSAPSGGARR